MKLNDEFRGMISGVQNDMQYKVEMKMTELVNKLMSEQDARQRQIEEVRNRSDQGDKNA